MRPRLVPLALAAALAVAGAALAQERAAPALVVKRDDTNAKRVLRGDMAGGRVVGFYETRRDAVDDLQVAAGNTFVLLLERTAGVLGEEDYAVQPTSRLVVLDAAGRAKHTVEHVWHYALSPDGRRAAIITGRHYEGGVGFAPEGVAILNLASGARTPVPADPAPFELSWLATGEEEALYMRVALPGSPVATLRYDLGTRRVSHSDRLAFHFSPDGEFYLVPPHEAVEAGLCDPGSAADSCLRVVERASGRRVPQFESRTLGTVVGWAYDTGHALLFTRRELTKATESVTRGNRTLRARVVKQASSAENVVYDAGTGREVERFSGLIKSTARQRTWVTSRGSLVVQEAQPAGRVPALRGLQLRSVPRATVVRPGAARMKPAPAAALALAERVTMTADTTLAGQPYRTLDAAQPDVCQQACQEDGRCRAYVFTRPGGAGQCRLLSDGGAASPSACCVSGAKAAAVRRQP